MNPNGERQQSTRGTLRFFGGVLFLAGVAFMIVGAVDFFGSFGSFDPPKRFWCFFVGMPLLFVGIVMLKLGFMGAVTRYVANEVTPVGKDVVNYMVDGTEDSIRKAASAVGEGLGLKEGGRVVRCHKCNADNDAAANFCDHCGAALARRETCPDCGELNDPDARFCDHCGKPLR